MIPPTNKTTMTVSTDIFAYLLKNCVYSQKMAKLLPVSQKKWVSRDSPKYFEYKEKYQSPTYPIILEKGKLIPGGSQNFLSFFRRKKPKKFAKSVSAVNCAVNCVVNCAVIVL
jgi:hypothetical protein